MTPTPTPAGGEHAPVVIVGAGPVGLTLALDLGRRGHEVVVLSRPNFIAAGSKAICFAKRSLDIFDRLGVGEAMMEKGVVWNVGKVFRGDRVEPIYQFDALPVKDQRRPAFINIQQYHVEERLVAALAALPNVDLRWGHEVVAVAQGGPGVTIDIATAADRYTISADYLVACDGSRSTVRDLLGLDFEGRAFEDNFLIADIRMTQERPAERWFWFDPPFRGARSALLHKQPDDIWRLDFQLGPDVDRAACVRPENVEPYVRAMLGADIQFEPEWYSVYTFQCRRMARFVHDRIVFAGDSAHLVSPFGARGCNGGIADADNLGWKLDLLLRGVAGDGLLPSYDHEATVTADENILKSSRSTDFMTPRSPAARAYRDAVLELAQEPGFGRPFVNSGRLSTAICYPDSPLNTADVDDWRGGLPPGSPAIDAPTGAGWLLGSLGDTFTLLADGWPGPVPQDIAVVDVAAEPLDLLKARYALSPGTAYLIRPDHYVAARWQRPTAGMAAAALSRATGL